MTLFDLNKRAFVIYYPKKTTSLESAKDEFDVRFEDSYMKGSYPNYEMFFNDKKNDIKLNLSFHADISPRWVAQDVTDGLLPLGLGFLKFGFIPKNSVYGTMQISNKIFSIKGQGYFEHVWGDFSYQNPLYASFDFKKLISTYVKLIGWWKHNHQIQIPKSITLSTENNPLGNDWIWAIFDNGWTIFYGNMLFWIMEGPAAGILTLSKDGTKYAEFGKIHFCYKKMLHAEEYDFVYPTEIELIAHNGIEKIHLRFKMSSECREFIQRSPCGKFWLALVVCEAPGKVNGYYLDGNKKIKLNGICKIEIHRQISKIGHNTLKINFILPPEGVGIQTELDSRFLKKKIDALIQFNPKPKIRLKINKLPK
jgi:hypothetical protein